MFPRWQWLIRPFALAGAVQGCGSEFSGDRSAKDVAVAEVSVVDKPAGARCGCDAECGGSDAICMLGICMRRAQERCEAPNSETGCDPGFRCFNTDILPEQGVCWPAFDPASCEGVKNRYGLCSPLRGAECDPACGAACTPDTVGHRLIGSACAGDSDCSSSGATCYNEASDAEPNGWVEGYCVTFGCKKSSECGAEAGCFPVADDGSNVCVNTCGADLDCRAGYVCKVLGTDAGGVCFPGCDAAATCAAGHTCAGGLCVPDELACSLDNPSGWCPKGTWCEDGACASGPFTCDTPNDPLEPNGGRDAAPEAASGVGERLTVCSDDEDWFRVEVPANTVVRVGVEFQNLSGDIDLVAYDSAGNLLGSRVGDAYPYTERSEETNTEYFGFYSEHGGSVYYVRVVGYEGAENVYRLHLDSFPYRDGSVCTDAGFSADDCEGRGASGSGLLPFPFHDAEDSVARDLYVWETFSNYRFARRELIMLVRDVLARTAAAFPGTTPLSLIDVGQIDGITPGYDIGTPRHPETTHDQGGSIDIAYFQTDGSNDAEIICGDGSKHADGFCSPAARRLHKVDLDREAFFMAKLFGSPRTRAIGIDKVIAPLVVARAKALHALPLGDPKRITATELAGFSERLGFGSGWPYHHHHIHLSMQWWPHDGAQSGGAARALITPPDATPPLMARPQ